VGPEEFVEYVYPEAVGRLTQTALRVDQYSTDITQRIKAALADYAKHSQESDRTFPERLVRFVRDQKPVMESHDIIAKMTELEQKRQRLVTLGFLDSETGLRDLSVKDVDSAPQALTMYVGDVQEKLRVFDQLAERVGKLMDIVNDRFKYKTLSISRTGGFSVRSNPKKDEPRGVRVQLQNLSSGEQHELVVLYELLFRVPTGGLVLIDEPEISLHVAWQARFLPDLIEILQLTGANALVATHSPVIIGERNDLAVALKGPIADSREVGQSRV